MNRSVTYVCIFLSSGEVSALHQAEQEAEAAATCLQAFVHYHHLYKHWWSSSALPAADSGPAGQVNGAVPESEGPVCPGTRTCDKLHFDASLLLSERHAAHQAAQRSVAEVQERLAALVRKHSRAQGGRGDAWEEEADASVQNSTSRGSSDVQQ